MGSVRVGFAIGLAFVSGEGEVVVRFVSALLASASEGKVRVGVLVKGNSSYKTVDKYTPLDFLPVRVV